MMDTKKRGRPPLPADQRLVKVQGRVHPKSARRMEASAVLHGRSISDEMRFAVDSYAYLSMLTEARQQGLDDMAAAYARDLSETLTEAFGGPVSLDALRSD